jgi:uncharacterized integral membrane protein
MTFTITFGYWMVVAIALVILPFFATRNYRELEIVLYGGMWFAACWAAAIAVVVGHFL